MTIHNNNTHRPRCNPVEYYVLTGNPKFTQVLSWLGKHNYAYTVHLNRTRFLLDTDSRHYTEFMLLYSECVAPVDHNADLVTGMTTDTLLTHIP